MFNPLKWLWENWHGIDPIELPPSPPELTSLPVVTVGPILKITLTVSNDDEDEFAEVGNLPIVADSLL